MDKRLDEPFRLKEAWWSFFRDLEVSIGTTDSEPVSGGVATCQDVLHTITESLSHQQVSLSLLVFKLRLTGNQKYPETVTEWNEFKNKSIKYIGSISRTLLCCAPLGYNSLRPTLSSSLSWSSFQIWSFVGYSFFRNKDIIKDNI